MVIYASGLVREPKSHDRHGIPEHRHRERNEIWESAPRQELFGICRLHAFGKCQFAVRRTWQIRGEFLTESSLGFGCCHLSLVC